jgi:CRISPR-associated protein Cas2
MWMVVMFDLPTLTKHQRNEHTKFRNYLLKQGFLMCQLSVYMRVLPGKEGVNKITRKIRENRPKKGKITLISITDKQYENIITFEDRIERREKNPEQLRLF